MLRRVEISGVGCCLVDYLFNNVSFLSDLFLKYVSKKCNDGGLIPGQLVFAEDFEKFSGKDFESVISEITCNRPADKVNIGGPGIVPLIHTSQMLDNRGCSVRFYGGRGEDKAGDFLQTLLKKTQVDINSFRRLMFATAFTVVLSDPDFQNGSGERIFINSIGAAGNYLPEYLDDQFFSSDVVVFGGTALVPAIHDSLTELLRKAKSRECITVVNTVYDFRSQKANPNEKWPLGKSDTSYRFIDLLITNYEEALRLSGENSMYDAMQFFQTLGTGAVVVTNGVKNISLMVNKNSIFRKVGIVKMPVSKAITEELSKGALGDTTGCGDNFAGGVIASMIMQLQNNEKKIDLIEASIWGIVSGGYSCFYMGGTYHQKKRGEKRKLIIPYYNEYVKQMKDGW